jgi:TonB-dependent SusC/RagA subfamily outer membrane receptor
MKIATSMCCLLLSFSVYAQHNETASDTLSNQPPVRLFRPSAVAPLYIVDKKEITEKELSLINAQDIEKMEVLHGGSAIERYGEKARNGVIIITTKDHGPARQRTVQQDTSAIWQPVTFKPGVSPLKVITPLYIDI